MADEENIILDDFSNINNNNNNSNSNLELKEWREGEAAELVWNRLSFEVKGKKILQDISGRAQGQLVGIMGSSGAGKTTLLYLLSDRVRGGKTEGKVLVNGEKMDKHKMKQLGGFVFQDDLFFSHLTVKETLIFAADMKMKGKGASKKERAKAVEDVIDLLGLRKCIDNIVGDDFRKGISGGERKRLSIGVELLGQPHLLFLDEPTSGLDSSTAHSVMKSLSTLTKSCTVLCTIHQPSATIFELFDLLCILSFGQVVYFGPPENATSFYQENNLFPKPFTNPADFVIDTISPDPIDKEAAAEAITARNLLVDSYADRVRQSNPNAFDDNNNNDDENKSIFSSLLKKKKEKKEIFPAQYSLPEKKNKKKNRDGYRKPLSPFWQFFLILSRTSKNYYRDWEVMLVQFFQNVGAAVLIGLFFFNFLLF